MPGDIEELDELAERLLASLGATPQLHALFKYLWESRGDYVENRDIWEKGGLKERSRTGSKKKSFDPKRPTEGFDYRPNIRQAVLDLRGALKRYFKKNSRECWRIDLPDAERGKGYRLRCIRVANDFKVTGTFWDPHLQGPGYCVSAVYVEQLFYHDNEKNLVFRYYDCNEEHSKEALTELYLKHGTLFKKPARDKEESVRPIYPYIAKGEALAVNLLGKWFSNYAAVKVQPLSTRNIHHDDMAEEDSLILFGSASNNRFIRKLLERHQDLPFRIDDRTRARISHPKHEDRQRIAHLENLGFCSCEEDGDDVVIEFIAEKGWPGILTRLPSHHTSRTPTTIFNSDFGTASHALADFLTDEKRLPRGLESLKIPTGFADYFQFLYCVDAVRDDAKPQIHAIAWRPYMPTAI